MSSFVIDKREYMKAAGIMHGIASSAKSPWEYFTENVKARFTRLYELNKKSVCEQYKRPFEGLDECEYQEVFNEYSSMAQTVWSADPSDMESFRKRKKICAQLIYFFSCVDYQIEDQEMIKEAHSIMFVCLDSYLVKPDRSLVEDSWGMINI